MKWLVLFLFAGCASTCPCERGAGAKSHLTLNLPASWQCKLGDDGASCREGDRKDEIVIWTMKETAATDTMAEFKKHLSSPISHETFASTPRSVKTVQINGVEWLDAVQEQSEIKGYTTRYLATVDGNLSVLVTFSATNQTFDEFSRRIQPVIDQLIVRR